MSSLRFTCLMVVAVVGASCALTAGSPVATSLSVPTARPPTRHGGASCRTLAWTTMAMASLSSNRVRSAPGASFRPPAAISSGATTPTPPGSVPSRHTGSPMPTALPLATPSSSVRGRRHLPAYSTLGH